VTFVLRKGSYGKSSVRLVKVAREGDRHELCDVTVDVVLEGDFKAAHKSGDNSALLATDTMRNTVYALAAQHSVGRLEDFGRLLVEHFVAAGPTVARARVRLVEHPWARLGDHDHAFQRAGGGDRVAVVSGDEDHARVEAGVQGLVLLRTTGSGWSGFLRDRFTTLPETDDRILATEVSARWSYAEGGLDYGAAWRAARDALLASFADHYSPSVQFTLQRMGEAVLKAVDAIERVHLSLPNRHHLLYDTERFGAENENAVFQATTEPYGLIEGTVERAQEGR
jgi:urate oxidase